MHLTVEQTSVTNDLLKFIKFKGIEIQSPEDLENAFRLYMTEGSASHFYLQKADSHQKKQFINRIKSEL